MKSVALFLFDCYNYKVMEIIGVRDISYRYPSAKNNALSHVSLGIEEGQFVALVGSNGSGKSTLAKMFNGLLVPGSGKVIVYNMETNEQKRLFDIRKKVGMVFQNPDNQMIATIVEDDLAFGPENLGVPRAEIEERIDWALSAVGMEGHRKSTPFKLSGGQKQRIAIAGVLAMKPKVLVLDEATAMLDPKGRCEVMSVLHRLNKEGITIIHITHHMEEALNADRVIVMNAGNIFMDGTPSEVFSNYEKLNSVGLALPTVQSVADMLKCGGMSIGNVMTQEQLVGEICQALK